MAIKTLRSSQSNLLKTSGYLGGLELSIWG